MLKNSTFNVEMLDYCVMSAVLIKIEVFCDVTVCRRAIVLYVLKDRTVLCGRGIVLYVLKDRIVLCRRGIVLYVLKDRTVMCRRGIVLYVLKDLLSCVVEV